MTDIVVKKVNDVNMFIQCSGGTAHELQDFFSYKADGYRFHPKFKAKMWDGTIRLFGAFRRNLYIGLLHHLKIFAKNNNYSIEIAPELEAKSDITPKEIVDYLASLNITSDGKPIIPRDYQYFAIYHAIRNKRATIIAPTAAGKSLNIYGTVRWFCDNYKKKALIIVPTISLVSQMYADFDDYSSTTKWNVEDHVHSISAGITKDTDKQIVVSTWQSIVNQPASWFTQFNMVYCDEVHGAKAKSIKDIMEKMIKCEYKIGTTGTTGSKKINDLLIQGVFGRIKKNITTKQLMDRGQVAKLKIKCVSLLYPEIDRKECRNKNYQEEINFLVKHTARNNMIIDSIGDMEGNHLILVNKVDHVKLLHEKITAKYPERNVFIIHGKTSKEEREKIRLFVDGDNKSTIVATYGTMSTGISIKNLNHVLFASPSKSEIRVLQSLGRVLRLSDRKSSAILWDIFDDLSIKKHKNFTLKHFIDRFKIYTKEKFSMEMIKVQL